MDLTAIASAIADRFNAAAITPPAGYTDPATATYRLPNAITSTPTGIVFPPEGEFSYAAFRRSGNLVFPMRWYIADTSDMPRATDAMYAWGSVLIDQLESQYDLDLAPIVTHAVIGILSFGKLEYADLEYSGIEYPVTVHIEEAFTPTT